MKRLVILLWLMVLAFASYTFYVFTNVITWQKTDNMALQQQNEAHEKVIDQIDLSNRLWLWEKRVLVEKSGNAPKEMALLAESKKVKILTDSLLQENMQYFTSTSPFGIKQKLVAQQRILRTAEQQQQELLKTLGGVLISCCFSCIRPFVAYSSQQVAEGNTYEAQLFLANFMLSRQRAISFEVTKGILQSHLYEAEVYLTPDLEQDVRQEIFKGKIHFVNSNDIDTTITVSIKYKIKIR